ncbi:MAG: tail-specific protease [Verrucomicrobiales bacterium]|nr:tail-specific protease [Verrucomicrobiales bacterium]
MLQATFSTFKRVASITLLTLVFLSASHLRAESKYGDLALRVVTMLEEEHFSRQPFNDKMSKRVLEAYLEMLDYSRIYFTKEDIERFRKLHELLIDDHVRNSGIPAAYDIYSIYEERVRDRVEFAKSLAKPNTFTYDSDRSIKISRKEAEWAPAGEAHDQLWRNLIEGDLIREKIIADAVAKKNAEEAEKKKEAGEEPKEPSEEEKKSIYEKVSDRYDRIQKRVNENETEDVATFFIKAIARAYDPHSEYFSQSQYDNFRIGMNKSLTGIGAMLQKDEEQGGATIEGLVVGGPAFKGGKLEVKDRVIGVAQGPEGEFTDVVEKTLSDIVDLIRGEIGTTVRLKVVSASAPDEIKLIDIIRDKIDLKESLATADLIITKDPEGNEQKLGWITLPSFYADMDGGQTSTTTDVRRLLVRLSIEGIDGLIIDLRDDGGGSLEEAINMTGLFIRRGPVVQSLDWRGGRDQKFSRNAEAVYGGPLIVLTNTASASASEIFAAALQDYGRAVIVGDESTFGKGTVQQLKQVFTNRLILPFNRNPSQEGALKLTIQTFYRINGHSTQRHGVVPDIQLPSVLDVADIGESSLPNALVVDPIQPSRYDPFFETPLPLQELEQASVARVASDPAFSYIIDDITREKKRIDENTLSLNLEQRRQESTDADKRREARKEERIKRFEEIRKEEEGLFTIYKLTQDNVLNEGLTLRDELSQEELSGMTRGSEEEEDDEESKALEYPHKLDPYERETLRVLQDLIAIDSTGKPVSISEAKPQPRDKTVPVETKVDQPN